MKHRLYGILIAAFCFLMLCGCSNTAAEADDRLHVLTTVFPQYDFVRSICGDSVTVEMLIPAGTDSHSFEPSPQDLIRISECDLFIYVGGESDEWVRQLLYSLGDSAPQTLTLMECVETVCVAEHDHEHEHAHSESEYDEHVWASPKNAMLICRQITELLCALDAENKEIFSSGYENYLNELTELDALFREIVNEAERTTIVVGDRFPFLYLAETYGIEYHSAFPGCSSESEPSAAMVAELIDIVKEENIPVVFHIEMSSHKVADAIAEATGAELLLIHSCHTLTNEELKNGCGYVSLMTQNAENLRKALN